VGTESRLGVVAVLVSIIAVTYGLGCLLGGNGREPPLNISLNRTEPGAWKGRLPGPSDVTLGQTNSIKGVQEIDQDRYTLTIDGAVENPMTMSFQDILEYPYLDRSNVMHCVEGWSFSADWRGIAIRDLLGEVVPKPEGRRVVFYAVDGYTSSFPIEDLNSTDSYFLAYMADGEFLSAKHGFPLRVIAEGKWGYKWVKWVTRMEIIEDANHRGFWESRGYSDDATVDNG
jgi:DMSO/TMAO reductase YedYZ molybdopterin-dependent catalytic subunit